jgi:hypothetical protein
LSLYIAQFVATGIIILVFFGYFASYAAYSYLLLAVDLIALALTAYSLSVISNALSTRWRILVGISMGIWPLSALLSFPFTPASIFTGSAFYGSATMLSLTVVVTAVAFRELSEVELGTMRSLIRATLPEVKNIRSFAGMSPIRAIFSANFSVFQFAGRINMGAVSRYQTSNVRISRVLHAMIVLALLYGYLALKAQELTLPGGPVLGNSVATLLPIFVLFFVFFSSQGGMANERAWLSLTAMEPALYFRYVSIAKLLSFLLVVSPFAAVDVALTILSVSGTLTPIIPLLVTIPLSIIIFLYWSSRMAPIQIKEEMPMMPSQFNLRQMSSIIPFIIFILATEVSAFFLLAAVMVAVATVALCLVLLYNRKAWQKLTRSLSKTVSHNEITYVHLVFKKPIRRKQPQGYASSS